MTPRTRDLPVPRGEVPAAVLEQRRREAELLEIDRKSLSSTTEADLLEEHGIQTPARLAPDARRNGAPQAALHQVTFELTLQPSKEGDSPVGCKIEFLAKDVSVDECSVSIAFVDNFAFSLAGAGELSIIYKETAYPVIWLGGVLNWKSFGLRGISFMRKQE